MRRRRHRQVTRRCIRPLLTIKEMCAAAGHYKVLGHSCEGQQIHTLLDLLKQEMGEVLIEVFEEQLVIDHEPNMKQQGGDSIVEEIPRRHPLRYRELDVDMHTCSNSQEHSLNSLQGMAACSTSASWHGGVLWCGVAWQAPVLGRNTSRDSDLEA